MSNRRGFIGGLLAVMGLGGTAAATTVEPTARLTPAKIGFTELKPVHRLRIWKLGNSEQKLYPSEQAIQRLSDLLAEWGGKGDLDLIWGPDISMEQHYVTEDDINIITANPDVKVVRPNEDSILKIEDPDKIMDEIDKKLDTDR